MLSIVIIVLRVYAGESSKMMHFMFFSSLVLFVLFLVRYYYLYYSYYSRYTFRAFAISDCLGEEHAAATDKPDEV